MGAISRYTSLGLLFLLSTQATPIKTNKYCVQLNVPVQISAKNTHFDTPRVDKTSDVANWVWDIWTWSHLNKSRDLGVIPVHDTFNINARLCIPTRGAKSHILQVATHGSGYDKAYWDVPVHPEKYSYLEAAINHGYSVLIYDRLGIGASSKPDAYDIVQLPAQVEVLKELTTLARNGDLIESSQIIGSRHVPFHLARYKPERIVHVGHSYGSVTTASLLSKYGEVSDGAILTGFVVVTNKDVPSIPGSSYGFEVARENDPERLGHTPSGYLVQGTTANIQQFFLGGAAFEPKLLRWSVKNKQTFTVGERLSRSTDNLPATEFKGPVQFFVGEYDFPFCDGDCKNAYDVSVLKSFYPAASDVSTYIQPATGHGLTVTKNATAGYQVIFSYLGAQGL
ncbi:hypothetical protein CHGG_09132 [Paecilomyces variotii No. 5]|uniref:AB hydrolase-1 domain-containing protein n=1 Tax=Byssochlamys spectabilis (strain No. 5 / NBRC 109023) TaxID=1356009 RepID=V5GCG0_BYSSN|nr:hypothetical protein CHGG_09132 [Paecilomyces variotii No. 5]